MTPKKIVLAALMAASFNVSASDLETGNAALKAGNFSGALSSFQAAASQGSAPAQHALAQLYEQGNGVVADPALARRWYEKAAVQGHAPSQLKLAQLLDQQDRKSVV